MRVKLRQLQQIVERALSEEKEADTLRHEIGRVLGATVVTEGSIAVVAESANERMDVLSHTGRQNRVAFKPGIMVKFLEHSDPNVRKLAARVVPQRYLGKLMRDGSPIVRSAVARRLPPNAVSEMLRRFPKDRNVREILRSKRLEEAGLPKPKVDDEPFDMYGDERLGDAARTDEGDELSQNWYDNQALRFIQDYGHTIEDGWEHKTVDRYCRSLKVTTGMEIDGDRLIKAIHKRFEDRDDRTLERNELRESVDNNIDFMPILEDVSDPVSELMLQGLSPSTFIERATTIFGICEGRIPPGIRKHMLGEENAVWQQIPVVGQLPHGSGFRPIDERALDSFCKCWNDRQRMGGEPIVISWNTSPVQVGRISFSATLR